MLAYPQSNTKQQYLEIDMQKTVTALIVTEPKSSLAVIAEAAKAYVRSQGFEFWELGPRIITDGDTLQRVSQSTIDRADLKGLADQGIIDFLIERNGHLQGTRRWGGWAVNEYLAALPGASTITTVFCHRKER